MIKQKYYVKWQQRWEDFESSLENIQNNVTQSYIGLPL